MGVREHLLLDCEALLSDEPEAYNGPLEELQRQLVSMLMPPSLHPQDASNALLELERVQANGLAELEQAGYDTRDITVYQFVHKLQYLEKKQSASNT